MTLWIRPFFSPLCALALLCSLSETASSQGGPTDPPDLVFSPPRDIVGLSASFYIPSTCAATDAFGRILLVFQRGKTTENENDPMYVVSWDRGETFSAPVNLYRRDGSPLFGIWPLCYGDRFGNFFVFWEDFLQGKVRLLLRWSRDGGRHFSDVIIVEPSLNAGLVSPRAGVDASGIVHLSYNNITNGILRALYRRSHESVKPGFAVGLTRTAYPLTFTSPVEVSDPAYGGYAHDMIVDDAGAVWIIWDERSQSGNHALVARSDDGSSFQPSVKVDPPWFSSYGTSLAMGPENEVYASVHAYDGSCVCDMEVYFTTSFDRGASFDPLINLSNDDLPSAVMTLQPAMQVDGSGRIHRLWAYANGLPVLFYYTHTASSMPLFSHPRIIPDRTPEQKSGASWAVDKNGSVNLFWTAYASDGSVFVRYSRGEPKPK